MSNSWNDNGATGSYSNGSTVTSTVSLPGSAVLLPTPDRSGFSIAAPDSVPAPEMSASELPWVEGELGGGDVSVQVSGGTEAVAPGPGNSWNGLYASGPMPAPGGDSGQMAGANILAAYSGAGNAQNARGDAGASNIVAYTQAPAMQGGLPAGLKPLLESLKDGSLLPPVTGLSDAEFKFWEQKLAKKELPLFYGDDKNFLTVNTKGEFNGKYDLGNGSSLLIQNNKVSGKLQFQGPNGPIKFNFEGKKYSGTIPLDAFGSKIDFTNNKTYIKVDGRAVGGVEGQTYYARISHDGKSFEIGSLDKNGEFAKLVGANKDFKLTAGGGALTLEAKNGKFSVAGKLQISDELSVNFENKGVGVTLKGKAGAFTFFTSATGKLSFQGNAKVGGGGLVILGGDSMGNVELKLGVDFSKVGKRPFYLGLGFKRMAGDKHSWFLGIFGGFQW